MVKGIAARMFSLGKNAASFWKKIPLPSGRMQPGKGENLKRINEKRVRNRKNGLS
jgi:hypothetical protein